MELQKGDECMCGVPDLRGRDGKSSWDAKPGEYKLDETQALYIIPNYLPTKCQSTTKGKHTGRWSWGHIPVLQSQRQEDLHTFEALDPKPF